MGIHHSQTKEDHNLNSSIRTTARERREKTLTCFIRLGPHVDDSHRDRENDSA